MTISGPAGQLIFLVALVAAVAYGVLLQRDRQRRRSARLAAAACCAVLTAVALTVWATAATAVRTTDPTLRLSEVVQHSGLAAVIAIPMLVPVVRRYRKHTRDPGDKL